MSAELKYNLVSEELELTGRAWIKATRVFLSFSRNGKTVQKWAFSYGGEELFTAVCRLPAVISRTFRISHYLHPTTNFLALNSEQCTQRGLRAINWNSTKWRAPRLEVRISPTATHTPKEGLQNADLLPQETLTWTLNCRFILCLFLPPQFLVSSDCVDLQCPNW